MKSLNSSEYSRIKLRRAEARERESHAEEVSLAAAILKAEPSLTRGQALREAYNIILARRSR